MGDQNHYAQLGVTEAASFEEIQTAKEHLLQECSGDRKQQEAIEAAYDAILMDRLRLRQEGKIKVPDRIRFPEKLVEPPVEAVSAPASNAGPTWLQRLIDTPSQNDILIPAGIFSGLSLLSVVSAQMPSVALALAVGFSLYFLNRKERKFGRAILLTLAALMIGVLAGVQIGTALQPQLASLNLVVEEFAAIVTCFVLWVTSSFLR